MVFIITLFHTCTSQIYVRVSVHINTSLELDPLSRIRYVFPSLRISNQTGALGRSLSICTPFLPANPTGTTENVKTC